MPDGRFLLKQARLNSDMLSFQFVSKMCSNQSLLLTETAVDDFAARRKIFKGKAMPAARIVYKKLAARRRSLAPVR